jgi:nucleoside-diphosphate-sugar epimerase
LQLISKIEGLIHKKAIIDNKPFHNADVDCTWADISKASKILEWQPEVALEEGIASTVEWYLENKEWLSKIDFHDK